ncbi:hypothetical protein C8R43DRAFT_961111 [Mycena crocata]|nr:hypothetical protein C8R43DRAFT_961111 [Mycena crocata]
MPYGYTYGCSHHHMRPCYILSQREDRKPCGGLDRPETRTRPEVEGQLFSQTPQLRRVCDCLTVKLGRERKGSTIQRAAGGGPEKRGNQMIQIDQGSLESKVKSIKDVRRSKVHPESSQRQRENKEYMIGLEEVQMWNKNLTDKQNGIVILDSIIGLRVRGDPRRSRPDRKIGVRREGGGWSPERLVQDQQDVKCTSVKMKDDVPGESEEHGKNDEGRSEHPDGGCKSESGETLDLGAPREMSYQA